MVHKEMSSLDFAEIVMAIEESFGIAIPDVNADRLGGPGEIVDWLEMHLSRRRIDQQAAALLTQLAQRQGSPEVAEGLDGTWRREQIAVVVREILRVHLFDDWSEPPDPDAAVRAPVNPRPRPRSGAARVLPKEQP